MDRLDTIELFATVVETGTWLCENANTVRIPVQSLRGI